MAKNTQEKYRERLENKKIQAFLMSKYQEQFRLHEWLLEVCMKCMDEADVQLDNLKKHIVYFLFIRGFRMFWSILILCKQGFGVEASLTLRALLNNLIALRFIGNDEQRAVRYAEFESVFRKHSLDLLKKSKTLGKEKKEELKKLEQEINAGVDRVKSKYELKNPRPSHWSGRSIKEMAKDVGLMDDYDIVYGQLSEIEHSGPGSIKTFVKIRGSDIVLGPGPSEEMIEIVLFTSFKYILDILKKTNEIIGLNAEVLLKEGDKRFREVYQSFILTYY